MWSQNLSDNLPSLCHLTCHGTVTFLLKQCLEKIRDRTPKFLRNQMTEDQHLEEAMIRENITSLRRRARNSERGMRLADPKNGADPIVARLSQF